MRNFFEDGLYFNNLHTATQALGLAVDTEHNFIYYLSTAGPGPAVKSIWSSLINPNSQIDADEWGNNLKAARDMQTEYKALSGTNFQHMVSVVRSPHLLVVADPRAAAFVGEADIDHVEARRQLLQNAMPGLLKTFIARLNQTADVPMQPAWASALWTAGLTRGGLMPLTAYGDCLGAWRIETADFDWLPVVQTLLANGQIAFGDAHATDAY